MSYTSDTLLQRLQKRGVIPASQQLFQSADMLGTCDEVIRGKIVPMIRKAREDFFVVTTNEQFVIGQAAYPIPYRAIGRALRDLKLVKFVANVADRTSGISDLTRISAEDEHLFQQSGSRGFYFKGDKIIVVSTPDSTDEGLELWWEMPPNRLCLSESSALVQSISGDRLTVTVSTIPASWQAGTVVDLIQGLSGCATIDYDLAIDSIAGNQVVFGSAVSTDLQEGDWISPAQCSPVIQLPDDFFPLLVALSAKTILSDSGDHEGAKALDDEIKELSKDAMISITPRVSGELKTMVNRHGLLMGRMTRYWRNRYRSA